MPRPVRRALLSVFDKTGLLDLARELQFHGVELIATGGTRAAIVGAGLPVTDVAEITKFPEIFDGRVKTLHPAIFGGLLAKRSKPEHLATLAEQGLPEIDLVVCNLYPFEQTVLKPDATDGEVVEQIDIGGPAMIRAAAKNFESVAVLVSPEQYSEFLAELAANAQKTTLAYRRKLAGNAFARIADYDDEIAEYFATDDHSADADEAGETGGWPNDVTLDYQLLKPLRHGENPHQEAALYLGGLTRACAATAEQLHGKELSYNNLLDLDSALTIVREFHAATAVVVKHNNPCGAASAATLAEAFGKAWDGDPLSAFGGIIAFNANVDLATAEAMIAGDRFVECVIAPDFDRRALDVLRGWKKNVRLLKTGPLDRDLIPKEEGHARTHLRFIDGGLLWQSSDEVADDPAKWTYPTDAKPSPEQHEGLAFAWSICKFVKSNAIVLGQGTQIVGVGAGQMSRVMSVEIAIEKAGQRSRGSVLASDAFFPFPDSIELATAAGVAAIAQPGGSMNDHLVIEACNRHGLAMAFTGVRHFRH